MTAFALLALHLGRMRDLAPTEGRRISAGCSALPEQIQEIVEQAEEIADVAKLIAPSTGVMFIGRRRGWPVAREGAQKLKEISYVHAEAYPSAELKHGPLALISPEHADGRDRPRRRAARQEHLDAVARSGRASGPVVAVAHRELPPELADRTVDRAAQASRSWTRS